MRINDAKLFQTSIFLWNIFEGRSQLVQHIARIKAWQRFIQRLQMTNQKHSLKAKGGGRYFNEWCWQMINELARYVIYDHSCMSSNWFHNADGYFFHDDQRYENVYIGCSATVEAKRIPLITLAFVCPLCAKYTNPLSCQFKKIKRSIVGYFETSRANISGRRLIYIPRGGREGATEGGGIWFSSVNRILEI